MKREGQQFQRGDAVRVVDEPGTTALVFAGKSGVVQRPAASELHYWVLIEGEERLIWSAFLQPAPPAESE